MSDLTSQTLDHCIIDILLRPCARGIYSNEAVAAMVRFGSSSWRKHMPDGPSGTAVDLDHAAKYKGRRVGAGANQGECATGVQVVFIEAGKALGFTRTWKQGKKVRGNKIAPGTAIATFRNGRYSNDHAAILIEERADGLWVWDQFNNPRKPWGKRLLPFSAPKNDRSNNGDLFYTIEK